MTLKTRKPQISVERLRTPNTEVLSTMGQDCTHLMEEGIQLNAFHFYSSILEVGFTIQKLDMCTKKHWHTCRRNQHTLDQVPCTVHCVCVL